MLGTGKARKEGTRRILPAAEESLNATGLPNYQQGPVSPKDPIIAPNCPPQSPTMRWRYTNLQRLKHFRLEEARSFIFSELSVPEIKRRSADG